ncbi:gamma-crystallin M2 isoform X1 [Salminus brasiliensis]|uniref:gamma-crystallin M2 isoform X1 n=1 Tax=Salminus brasiliensis TaxID=930266 RepID=UPI003B835362
MGKIVFYEDKQFNGFYYECSNDCADMLCYLKCCNSIKVEDGCFMIYEQPHYSGQQYFLSKGEYPEYQEWAGLNDSIGSCRMIPKAEVASFEMQLFERMEYGGQMMDLADDCPSVMECFHTNNIFSCKVMGGNWLFFEQPYYSGRMYLIRPGEYTRFSDWGGMSARVGSIKRIVDTY